MSNILDLINFEEIIQLMESIKALGLSLVGLYSDVFGWLGNTTLIALTAGIAIAIILRVLGR